MSNIPGAYPNSNMDDIVTVKLRGRINKIIELTATELYGEYVTVENRKPVLYARLRKELYGYLRITIIFYWYLLSELTKLGLQWTHMEPMYSIKQWTVFLKPLCGTFDNIKLLHVIPMEITKILSWTE